MHRIWELCKVNVRNPSSTMWCKEPRLVHETDLDSNPASLSYLLCDLQRGTHFNFRSLYKENNNSAHLVGWGDYLRTQETC